MSIAKESIDQIWTNAYTEHGFQDKEVDLALVEKALELALLGPSSYNCSPLRIVIVHTPEGKKKLIEAIQPHVPMNVDQTQQAPVNIIVCVDKEFEDKLDFLMPVVPNASSYFKAEPNHSMAMNLNGTLQAGYLIMALRAIGLNCGPEITLPAVDVAMGIDKLNWEGKFIINVGYGIPEKRYPRAPRLSMEQATKRM